MALARFDESYLGKPPEIVLSLLDVIGWKDVDHAMTTLDLLSAPARTREIATGSQRVESEAWFRGIDEHQVFSSALVILSIL